PGQDPSLADMAPVSVEQPSHLSLVPHPSGDVCQCCHQGHPETLPDEEAPGDETCPICLGQLSDASRMHPCGHCFCRQCIQPWATQRFTCPMCHGRIEAIERLEPRAQRDASTRQRLERNMGMA
uniref:RING-type domain-containing protein n=1 Tax=Anas platyrhynchos TaxID=8839 RepID=A0A8B9TND7_ANAPL